MPIETTTTFTGTYYFRDGHAVSNYFDHLPSWLEALINKSEYSPFKQVIDATWPNVNVTFEIKMSVGPRL